MPRQAGPQAQASKEDVERAVGALDREARPLAARAWPSGLQSIDQPGLYSWWVDREGARHLSEGLGYKISPGRIYAGQAGAQRGNQANKATLGSRIRRNHLGGTIRASTFRLTLAAALLDVLGLQSTWAKRLERTSERALTAWMRAYLDVAVFPYEDRHRLRDLEATVLQHLDPPLNLEGRGPTPLRAALQEKRARLGSDPSPPGTTAVSKPDSTVRDCPFCVRIEAGELE